MVEIHPDVRNALLYADTVRDHLLSHIDQMRSASAERHSEDGEIAVKVDMTGQLTGLWFKPGLLDRKPADAIAKELTRLVSSAAKESAEHVARLFSGAHEYPTFTDVVAEYETSQREKQQNAATGSAAQRR